MQSKTNTPNTETLAFQKWLKVNYPDADLGNYGNNKDGIDGIMGAKTKALFDKYGREFKSEISRGGVMPGHLQNLLRGVEKIDHSKDNNAPNVSELINDSKISNDKLADKTVLPSIDDLYKKKVAENIDKTTARDKSDASMLQKRGIVDLLPTTIGGLYGLSQLAQQKNITPPKRVEPMLPNQQLNTLLAQVGVNANMADPKIRENAIRDITTNREIANEMARVGSGGDVTAFSQNAQNNYLKSNDAIRKLASDESADILKNRTLYGNLLTDKMQEDRLNHNERIANFNSIDYPEFKAQRENNALLSNQGINNLFGAVQNGVDNSPLLSGYNNIMSGYKARYATMSPEEKKAFRINYPKLASKYDAEMLTQNNTLQNNTIPISIPQQLPNLPLSYNWTM